MANHYFDLDIPKALVDQLTEALSQQDHQQLTRTNLELIESKLKGVYLIFAPNPDDVSLDMVKYVGKAKCIRDRLKQHFKKLSGRNGFDINAIKFKYLSVSNNWSASVPEEALIEFYRSRDEAEWNTLGFGAKDQGRNRDDTELKEGHFDQLYPIRDSLVCDWIEAKEWSISDLLRDIKSGLPYLLRYDKSNKDLSGKIVVKEDEREIKVLLSNVVKELPAGWQATLFPWQVILYKNHKEYPEGTIIKRK